ncbi:MAG: hypothetical protein HT580_00655 [Dechloromonas sp.]|nr:MAG: hypothetical protein HT580_00655 [Dechloromonas sp.]
MQNYAHASGAEQKFDVAGLEDDKARVYRHVRHQLRQRTGVSGTSFPSVLIGGRHF